MNGLHLGFEPMITDKDIFEDDDILCSLSTEALTLDSDITKAFESIDQLCTGLLSVGSVKSVIERDGVTPAFYDMFNTDLISHFEIDLTTYVKKSSDQCFKIVTSLEAIENKFIKAIIDFFKSIGDWFFNLFHMWINTNERYKHRINKLNQKLTMRLSRVDTEEFAKTSFSGYPYVTYVKIYNAMINMLSTLKGVDYDRLENLNIKKEFGTDLIACGYTFDTNGSMVAPTTTQYINLPARRLNWTPSKVWEFSKGLVTKMLVDNDYLLDLNRKIQKPLDSIILEIERIGRDNSKVDTLILEKKKAALQCLKHIVQYMLKTMAGISSQYIRMCKSFKYED